MKRTNKYRTAIWGGICRNAKSRVVNFGLIGLKLARLAKFKRTEIHHELLMKITSDIDNL